MIRLVEKDKPVGIWVGDMKDGDVGVIVDWGGINMALDHIVQRYKDSLVSIGRPSGSGWSFIFRNGCDLSNDCCIRLLEKGETLVVI